MDGETVFNYAVGALALFSALVSTALYYRSYLPSTQMKILDELLTETKDIYDKAVFDGLLPSPMRVSMKQRLSSLETTSNSLRVSTYNATTSIQEYTALLQGLSRKIMRSTYLVKKFRATLITTSEKQRYFQMREQRSAEIDTTALAVRAVSSANQNCDGELERPEQTPPSVSEVEILRPGSCPPNLDCTISLPATPCILETQNVVEITEFDDNLFLEIDDFAAQAELDSLSRSSTLVESRAPSKLSVIGIPFSLSRWLAKIFKTKATSNPDTTMLPV